MPEFDILANCTTATSYWNTLGVAHYRAEEWSDAVAALAKSMELLSGDDTVNWLFLAMARWQLGEREEALELYRKAVQWMGKNKPGDEELLRFRAEAVALLGLAEKSAEKPEK